MALKFNVETFIIFLLFVSLLLKNCCDGAVIPNTIATPNPAATDVDANGDVVDLSGGSVTAEPPTVVAGTPIVPTPGGATPPIVPTPGGATPPIVPTPGGATPPIVPTPGDATPPIDPTAITPTDATPVSPGETPQATGSVGNGVAVPLPAGDTSTAQTIVNYAGLLTNLYDHVVANLPRSQGAPDPPASDGAPGLDVAAGVGVGLDVGAAPGSPTNSNGGTSAPQVLGPTPVPSSPPNTATSKGRNTNQKSNGKRSSVNAAAKLQLANSKKASAAAKKTARKVTKAAAKTARKVQRSARNSARKSSASNRRSSRG